MLSDLDLGVLIFSSVAAYLCGSIPTGALIAKRQGIAVQETGSGNIGATNVARTAGKKAGILTLIGDILKGLFPVLIIRWLGLNEIVQASAAVMAILGHLFPVLLRFVGGKGVATGLGVFLGPRTNGHPDGTARFCLGVCGVPHCLACVSRGGSAHTLLHLLFCLSVASSSCGHRDRRADYCPSSRKYRASAER